MSKRCKQFIMLVIVFPMAFLFVSKVEMTQAKTQEIRAVWISYLDFDTLKDRNVIEFRANFEVMCDNAQNENLNTLIVHVRSFSDAIYPSNNYHWGSFISDRVVPDYDPLAIMIEIAHQKGLRLEAWINPYRVANSNYQLNIFKEKSPFASWLNDDHTITYGDGKVILNPANEDVVNHIVDGVSEIVSKYDVDGIHMDDYFYVTGSLGDTTSQQRKDNVNVLISRLYSRIKEIDSNVTFGISPQGNIENCRNSGADVDTWLSTSGYVDYVMPQVYWTDEWGNDGATSMYSNRMNQWSDLPRASDVKLLVGLALYKTVNYPIGDVGWGNSSDNLQRQYKIMKDIGWNGFSLFSYRDMINSGSAEELLNLRKETSQVCNIYKKPDNTAGVVYISYLKGTCYEEWTANGNTSGKTDKRYPIQGIRLNINGYGTGKQITYRSYSNGSWQKWKGNGALSGDEEQPIEAFQVILENMAGKKVEYRANIEGVGWSEWKKNGEVVGVPNQGKAILGYEVKISEDPIAVGTTTFTALKKNGSNNMYLQWDNAQNATGYNIYGYDESTGTWKYLKATTGLSTSVKGIEAGAFCRYRIRAFNTSRAGYTYYGNYSNSKSTVNLDTTKITRTVQNGNGIYMTWQGVKGANLYKIYRYNETTKIWEYLKATTGTSTTDRASIKVGQEYYYKVRAVRLRNFVEYHAGYSETERGIILQTPVVVKKSTGAGSINITWDKVYGATGYNIYMYNEATKQYKYVSSVINARNYETKGLESDKYYSYLIKAYKKANNGKIYYSRESRAVTYDAR